MNDILKEIKEFSNLLDKIDFVDELKFPDSLQKFFPQNILNLNKKDKDFIDQKITPTLNLITEIYDGLASEHKSDYVKKIINDYSKIKETLKKVEKIKDCPVVFEVSIVGGAIRDLILAPEKIKDLDILVRIYPKEQLIPQMYKHNWSFRREDDGLIQNNIMEKVLLDIGWDKKDVENFLKEEKVTNKDYNQRLGIYFLKKMEREKSNIEIIDRIQSQVNEEYHFNDIHAVIKMSDLNLNFPADLLISNHSSSYNFVDKFDYNLCKIYVDDMLKNDKIEKDNIKSFINSIWFNSDFLQDVINKNITMDIDHYPLESASNSFEKHFKKIKEKYTDYKFNFVSQSNDQKCPNNWIDAIDYVRKIERRIELSKEIEIDKKPNRSVKI